MKLLIAINFASSRASIIHTLGKSDIKRKDIGFVTTIDDFLEELESGQYDFIITEYCINGADIWQIAKLVNSAKYSAHRLPIFLIQNSCETEIPPILAKECTFQVIALEKLGDALVVADAINQTTGNRLSCLDALKNKLLVIDDDDDAVFFAVNALKDEFEVDIAYDGLTGYQLWENNRHELILLDLMLPGMMGDLVLEKIMEIDPNQPIIIITGHDQPNNHRELLLNGASEYLCKPYAMTDLKDQCRIILNRAKIIYQAQYLRKKLEILGSLFWVLDQAIAHDKYKETDSILFKINSILPYKNLSDDRKHQLINHYG